MDIFKQLKQKIQIEQVKIVFPEANDDRVLEAACKLAHDQILIPILLGDSLKIEQQIKALGYNTNNLLIVNPVDFEEREFFAKELFNRRKGKITEDEAYELLKDPNYFGTMMVYLGHADGMVSGAIHSTADTVRPALQIIKTKPNISRVSGAFLMTRGEEKYIFADCAINVKPDANLLAEIALESAKTAELFDIEPKVALLSFSTKGSAKSEEVDKVVKATEIVQKMNENPNYHFEGELQFDAAFDMEVAKLKAPNSKVAGKAKVFIFPDLQAGNIGYKIAQRLGGFEAVGPILQGLNQPVSDLSRGCNVDEVYKVSIITAAQVIFNRQV